MSDSIDATIQKVADAAASASASPVTPIVIKEDRSIVVPTALQQIAVQCDNEANVLHFECPRNWADIDLATATLYINAVKPDNSSVAFVCTNVASSADTVTFDWVITEYITEVAGKLSFLVCARDPSDPGDGYRWHSNLCNSLFVAPGIVCTVPSDTLDPPHIPLYGTDTTLTEPGVPADAAVVGDRLNRLEESLELSKWSHRNLLDNSYWANADSIIDQRGGYVVPPGVIYYIPGGESQGLTDKYYPVDHFDPPGTGSGAYFYKDGTLYITDKGRIARGYTGPGYGIDRWILQAVTSCTLIINDGYITLYAKDNDGLLQKFPADQFSDGDTVTVSVLTDTELLSKTITLTESVQIYPYDNSIWRIAVGKSNGIWLVWPLIVYNQSAEQAINIKAAKLELGSQQTLTHQDADGNWVLNEIPDYGEQLASCQRYHINLHQNESLGLIYAGNNFGNIRVAVFDIPTPVTMRAKPVITDVVAHGILIFTDGTQKAVEEVIVDCCHAASVRVFVRNTGLSVFGPVTLADAKFSFSADL